MRRKPSVLIVDDEEDFLEIMRLHLAMAGFRPHTLLAPTAEEVIQKTEEILPDAILLDAYPRGLSTGIGIARAVRVNLRTQQPRIFFWSNGTPHMIEAEEGGLSSETFLDKTADLYLVTENIGETIAVS